MLPSDSTSVDVAPQSFRETNDANTIGPYEILEVAGRGGMGVVYRGRHVETGELAAIKTVRSPCEDLMQRIRREVHALSRIRHPGIVRIVGEGIHQGLPWYAMEMLEGQPLDRFFASLAGDAEPGDVDPSAWSFAPATRAGTVDAAAGIGGSVGSGGPGPDVREMGVAAGSGGSAGSGGPGPDARETGVATVLADTARLAGDHALTRRVAPFRGGAVEDGHDTRYPTYCHRACERSAPLEMSCNDKRDAPPLKGEGSGEMSRSGDTHGPFSTATREGGEGTFSSAATAMVASLTDPSRTSRPIGRLGVTGSWPLMPGAASADVDGLTGPGPAPDGASSQGSHPPLSPRLRLALTLVRRLCEPLAFLHGEGLVHRDLKPDNVIVRGDGSVVIVDFGLVERFTGQESREDLAITGEVAGTLLYMAPEQMLGQPADARADLHALGCILYQLITGAPPFAGSSAIQIIAARLEREVVPPSELVPDLPLELDTLVMRLLAREPRARLGYAGDLARMLEALGAEPIPPGTAVRSRDYLYRPGFSGRREILEALGREVSTMVDGRGGLVLLGGESGVGKTRLAVELAREHRDEVAILQGDCSPGQGHVRGGAPLEAFRPTFQRIADRCRAKGPAETERLLGCRAPLFARYEPDLAGIPGAETYLEPAELEADAARLRLFTWLGDVLEALCAGQPTLLLLDDLQWADELSLGALEHLAVTGRLERLSLLVLGTYRSEEVGEPLQRLLELPVRRYELSRLDEVAVGEIIADMLATTELPPAFVRFLTRTSEGNPLFAAEYLHAVVAEGLLFRDEEGRWSLQPGAGDATGDPYERLSLPRSLRALIGRRLEGLSAEAQRLVEAAAVLGRELDAMLLAAVAVPGGRPDDTAILEATRELLTRQVLEEAGRYQLRFAHDKLREVAYDHIDAPRRASLHRRAAEALERSVAGDPGARASRLAELGRHWENAGEPVFARDCYLEAARHAARRHALAEAERLYRASLALIDAAGPVRVAARLELASKVLAEQGRLRAALELGQEVLAEARGVGDAIGEAGALGDLAALYVDVGELDAATETGHAALERLRRIGDRRATAAVLGSLAHVALIRGRRQEALTLGEEAATLSRLEGDTQAEAVDLNDLATIRHALGQLTEAEETCHRGLEIARTGGHRSAEAKLLTSLAGVYYSRGELQATRAPMLKALAIFQEIGDRAWEGRTLRNLGAVHKGLGDLDAARRYCEDALALHRASGDRRWEAITLEKLAEIAAQHGVLERARELFQQAIAGLQALGDRKLEAHALGQLAGLEVQAGRRLEARRRYEAAAEMLRALGEEARLRQVLERLEALSEPDTEATRS